MAMRSLKGFSLNWNRFTDFRHVFGKKKPGFHQAFFLGVDGMGCWLVYDWAGPVCG